MLLLFACAETPETREPARHEIAVDVPPVVTCGSVVDPDKAREAAQRLLAATYYREGDRCYMARPTGSEIAEYECSTVLLWLNSRERTVAEHVADELGGSLLRDLSGSCSALIYVDPGSELENLRQAWALPEVLQIDMNWMVSLEIPDV